MISFSEVLTNVGDFVRNARADWMPGDASGHDPVIADRGMHTQRGEVLSPIWEGRSNAYSDDDVKGFRMVRPVTQGERVRIYETNMLNAARLIKSAFDGNGYAKLALKEAMSTSDFPQLFGDVIDRSVLANYRETPYTWNQIAKLSTVNDFRKVERFRIDYGTGIGSLDASNNLIPVAELGPYPEDKITDDVYSYRVQKYGRRMPFSWETFINDDLNAIKDTPARFGRAMRRMEEYFVTKLFANNTTYYTAGNKNTVIPITGTPYTATNPALSITALAQGMTIMSQQRDPDGGPIDIESVILVVGPGNKITAQNILNADYIWANSEGGTVSGNTSSQRLQVRNWAKNAVTLVVNYFLPIVDSSHLGAWYLFASPNNGRPAMEFGKLRGHEAPDLFMKSPNAIAIGEGNMGPGAGIGGGGGLVNPFEGDFDQDGIHYKIRHVFGGVMMDPLMSVYSNGTGA